MKRVVQVPRNRSTMDSTMTPMIDVIFQLQIFFLCTTGFQPPESLLPTPIPNQGVAQVQVQVAPAEFETVRVNLRGAKADLKVVLNDRPLSGIAELTEALRRLGAASPELSVVMDMGGEVVLGDVVRVYDACLAAGLRRINFAARPQR